ncbi:MAG TPA: tetratricopeptide repeat protein [Terriglobales bacterium]|nr:tetratricopeptide repeat protein [Terriglobales bacterium]
MPALRAQTFEIGNQPAQSSPNAPAHKGKAKSSSPPSSSSEGIGWGNSIELGRVARAAEQALHKGNYAAATEYAQRAVQSAPQNAKLWFLLGYTSRLAGKYQTSIDAYNRGLSIMPASPEGLSGMAQTYSRAGNIDEAKSLLNQVLKAHPDRIEDLLMLGELYIRTDEIQQGLNLLWRGEAKKPSAHTELLMATAYMRLKQMPKAKELLDRARKRDPKNVEIFRAVANFQRQDRDYAGSIATLKSAPRMTAEIMGDLGYTYELAGDNKEAAVYYTRAANAERNNINMQLNAAQLEIALADFDKGNLYLQRAASIDENHYRLHALRGSLARLQNRTQDAIREYNFALAHLPQGTPPEGELYPVLLRLNLAELYKDIDDEADAKQQIAIAENAMKSIHAEGPAQAEFLRVRASLEMAFGDTAAAEADLKQAMSVDPNSINVPLEYATLLWKTNRKDEARKMYAGVLNREPKNRYALEGMGYLARDAGDNKSAEEYFNRLAEAYPNDYVAHLALGDLFTATRDFARANAAYENAYKHAPQNAVVVANATNAAIEARKFDLAGLWIKRATGAMNDDSRVMRERERYLFHTGKYLESARLGYQVLQRLPKDRNASVYLGYALYDLGRYDDVLALTTRYENILPKEPNFPLLTGHVHKQSQLLDQAADDYGRAIERDPKMVEAYVNRGYVENDLQQAQRAVGDFHQALEMSPNNGIARLGLAFADLQLRRGKDALEQADAAQKLMGESGATHLARATAYRQMRSLANAEKEYRTALKYAPDEEKLHMALADTLYHERHYSQAIAALNDMMRLELEDRAQVYAEMAHNYAYLRRRDETMRYVKAAEEEDHNSSAILLDTGDALLTLGDHDAAMERFARALDAPDADRVQARLAIAKLFVRDGKWDDARQQVGLAFAEARVGEASPVTADDLVEAANIFLAIQDFDLAERYFAKARQAGASDEAAAVGLANAYLAQGNDRQAEAELASLGDPAGYVDSYDYSMAMGNVYRHRGDNVHAMTSFARANQLAGEDDQVAENELMEVAGQEGLRLGEHVSLLSDLSTEPIYDDPTIYQIDAKLFNALGTGLLPAPRVSTQTMMTNVVHLHEKGLPPVHGMFQIRDARGVTSIPSEALILRRDTHDYTWNLGIAPTLHLGSAFINLDTGVQYTWRRDSLNRESALAMNQNLFRQFLYLNTSSFGNWLAIRGLAFHEAGPFTERHLSSKDNGAKLEFVVGRPWGKTALITGYYVRDLQFDPLIREFFTTSTYAGLERKFGQKLKVTALGEYIRSWRVQDFQFAAAQSLRPAGSIEFKPTPRWSFNAEVASARGQGFHSYDNVQGEFLISYSKPVHRNMNDGTGEIPIDYPLRFSVGIEQQKFFNFAGRGQTFFRPVVRLTLF